MRKKYLSALLFGALFFASTATFTSCKDYDDEIDGLQEQVDAVKGSVDALQKKIEAGNWVTSVTDVKGGFEVAFNDGKKYTIVSGANGADGKPGADGKAGTSWRINETNNNWEYSEDGGKTWKDTGICAKGNNSGKSGVSPVIDEATGKWKVWNDEKGEWVLSEISAKGADTYVVNFKLYYELNIMQYVDGKATEYTKIKLPKTALITNFEVVSINEEGEISEHKGLELKYGVVLSKDVTFNGKTYKKGTYLVANTEDKLSILVNPIDADATKYNFNLVNSKGKTPLVVTEVVKNMTEKPLSRTATENQGAYDLNVTFAGNTELNSVDDTYSLVTETVDAKVAAPYSVNVTTKEAKGGLEQKDQEDYIIAGNYHDLMKNVNGPIVDCVFEVADKTIAEKYGIKIENGKIIATNIPVGESVEYFKINVKALIATKEDIQETSFNLKFKYATPAAAELSPVVWTINKEKKDVYISIKDIKSQLGVTSDTDIAHYYVGLGSFTWADGSELDSKTIEINDNKYGKDGQSFNSLTGIFPTVDKLYTFKNGKYKEATNINEDLYVKFAYNEITAFPGEFATTVKFNNGFGNTMIEVPIKVTTKVSEKQIVKLENYFNGNNAVAYGVANGTTVTFDLNKLFKTEGLTFTETPVKDSNHNWLSGGSQLEVLADDGKAENNKLAEEVYTTREITAKLVNKNKYIQNAEYKFNMTVKSELFEGTFTSDFTADVINDLEIPVHEFDLKDVNGLTYYMAPTKVGTEMKKADERIIAKTTTIEAADDNAKNYLNVQTGLVDVDKKSSYFKVTRKADAVLNVDTPCKLKVSFTDKWGKVNSTVITVTLKKNAK